MKKDFYKAFPDEASFRAKYGKELKQMQYGGDDLELYGGVVPLKEAWVVLKTQIKIMVITILILKHLKQVLILQGN
jgi:hypothetical protein